MGGLNLAADLLPGAITAAQTVKDYQSYQADKEADKIKYQRQQQEYERNYQEQLARQEYERQKRAIDDQNDRARALADQQKAQQDAQQEREKQQYELQQRADDAQQRQFNQTKLAYSQKQDLSQLIQRQDLDFAAASNDSATRQQQIQLDAANNEAARQSALRRAVARQRATFGARGITTDSGSTEAVLLGLYKDSDADRIQSEKLDRIRQNALADDLTTKRQRNLLERTQLAEAQKFQLLTYRG